MSKQAKRDRDRARYARQKQEPGFRERHAAKCLAAWHRRKNAANEKRRERYFRTRSTRIPSERELAEHGFSIVHQGEHVHDTTHWHGQGQAREWRLEKQADAILKRNRAAPPAGTRDQRSRAAHNPARDPVRCNSSGAARAEQGAA